MEILIGAAIVVLLVVLVMKSRKKSGSDVSAPAPVPPADIGVPSQDGPATRPPRPGQESNIQELL